MGDTADRDGGDDRRERVRAALPSETLELIAHLDRELEDLRQLAPPGYDLKIAALTDAMAAVHEAIDGPLLAKRR